MYWFIILLVEIGYVRKTYTAIKTMIKRNSKDVEVFIVIVMDYV